MGTSIVVMGIPRSGTSAVAGILHHLGIYMGENFPPPSGGNPNGYFEDMEFVAIHESIMGIGGSAKNLWINIGSKYNFLGTWAPIYMRLLEKRDERGIWGLKDPRLCFFFDKFQEMSSSEIKVIAIHRKFEDVVQSVMDYVEWANGRGIVPERKQAARGMMCYKNAMDKFMRNFKGDVLNVDFEDLMDHPLEYVKIIAKFANNTPITQAALDHVDPKLRNK